MRLSVPAVFIHGLFGPFAEPAAFRQLGDRECTAPDLDGYGAFTGHMMMLERPETFGLVISRLLTD